MDKEIYEKIIKKKEFSKLPKKDVELIFNKFDKPQYIGEEKIKLTRDLLRKVFSVFASEKLFNLKNKDAEWILRKHLSTRERLNGYKELYSKIFLDSKEKINIIDLGAGVNGFSYSLMKEVNSSVNYFGVEAVGQLVDLMNVYFLKEKFNAKAFHLSLFELEKIKTLIQKIKGNKIIFLFKTLDSLEMVERDYSKKFLGELVPLVDKVVVSFATRSLVARKKFNVQRNWIVNFIKTKFKILDDFELSDERYLILQKK